MHAYCLFCETQKCKIIAQLIERNYHIQCISPEIIQRKWTKGKCEEKYHDWLPGYVFLFTEEPLEKTPRIPGVIRLLGNGELHGTDLAFATMLREQNGAMGTIQLTEIGQYCIIADPLWEKMEGKVIKIDRGRRRCCIEFTFDKIIRTVWLGYELVKPLQ